MDLGLDIEAYKDYVNNLKKFAHLHFDFQLFAQDSLKLDMSEHRELIVTEDPNSEFKTSHIIDEEVHMEARCKVILNTIMKLRREGNAFLNDRDKKNIDELILNMRDYIYFNLDILESLHILHKRRSSHSQNTFNS